MLKPIKIKDFTIKYPIIQGGMGVGVSWDRLASAVTKEGGLGVISAIGTGYYQRGAYSKYALDRPKNVQNFYSKESLFKIVESARTVCGDAPLAVNILYAINDYGRVIRDACEAGI